MAFMLTRNDAFFGVAFREKHNPGGFRKTCVGSCLGRLRPGRQSQKAQAVPRWPPPANQMPLFARFRILHWYGVPACKLQTPCFSTQSGSLVGMQRCSSVSCASLGRICCDSLPGGIPASHGYAFTCPRSAQNYITSSTTTIIFAAHLYPRPTGPLECQG